MNFILLAIAVLLPYATIIDIDIQGLAFNSIHKESQKEVGYDNSSRWAFG
jgi:hypothetical protein